MRKINSEDIRKNILQNGVDPTYKPIPGKSFTILDLHVAFRKVQNEDNWKLPIHTYVDEQEVELVEQAIVFFTGGGAKRMGRDANGRIEIHAEGYYHHVGA